MDRIMRIRLPSPLSARTSDAWEAHPSACRRRALLGALLLRAVLRSHLGGAGPAREVVESVLEHRYRPLLSAGELSVPEDAERGLKGIEVDVRTEAEGGAGMDAVAAYSAHVLPLLASLESYTALWVANYVEYVALASSPIGAIVPFLESVLRCL